jgi:hypothetical protein
MELIRSDLSVQQEDQLRATFSNPPDPQRGRAQGEN